MPRPMTPRTTADLGLLGARRPSIHGGVHHRPRPGVGSIDASGLSSTIRPRPRPPLCAALTGRGAIAEGDQLFSADLDIKEFTRRARDQCDSYG